MVTSGLVSTQRHYRIRSIFLNRRESYGLSEARRLSGHSPTALRRAIANGEIEATETTPGDYRIPWLSLAALAVDTWGVEAIEEELGATHSSFILPPLARYQAITLRLPRYQIAMLQELAKRPELGGISRIVSDALVTIAEEHAEAMEAAIPGFAEAFHYPERAWKRSNTPRADEPTAEEPE
jgi:hypothetical protein